MSAPVRVPASALARPLDPAYPSNRFAALGLLTGVVAARLSGRSWGQALVVGSLGFTAWAVARELDPDHPDTACAALPLAAGVALLDSVGWPAVLSGVGVLSGLRVLSGTTGRSPTPTDQAALGVQAGVAALLGDRAAALVPGAALWLSQEGQTQQRPTQGGQIQGRQIQGGRAEGLVIGAGFLPPLRASEGRSVAADLLALAALGLSGSLMAPEAVSSRTDQTHHRLNPERVQRSRQVAAGALALGLLRRESRTLVPLAAAALTVGLRRVVSSLKSS